MALVEDMLKGNLLIAGAIGVTALVLPKILPDLSPSLRGAVKTGLSLFLESESEAEHGLINRLADTALENVLKQLSGPGSPHERQQGAEAVVEGFKRQARARSRRYGRNEHDRSTRYRRHIGTLQGAIERRKRHGTGVHAAALDKVKATLDEA
jgi:hypothetical protein